jgi:hypothetical protein
VVSSSVGPGGGLVVDWANVEAANVPTSTKLHTTFVTIVVFIVVLRRYVD